jgi:hypothetical protein
MFPDKSDKMNGVSLACKKKYVVKNMPHKMTENKTKK